MLGEVVALQDCDRGALDQGVVNPHVLGVDHLTPNPQSTLYPFLNCDYVEITLDIREVVRTCRGNEATGIASGKLARPPFHSCWTALSQPNPLDYEMSGALSLQIGTPPLAYPPAMVFAEQGRPMNNYNLYVKINGVWSFQARIVASNHSEAFQKAMQFLKPEHYTLQIRLEQEDGAPPPDSGKTR